MSDAQMPTIMKFANRISNLPSCSINLDFLKRLLEIFCEINDDAIIKETDKLEKNPENTLEEFEKYKQEIIEARKIRMQIYGTKGETIVLQDVSDLKENILPDNIKNVVYDNFSLFQLKYGFQPGSSVKLEFDFTKQAVFDFTYKPSNPTINFSTLDIGGSDATWVNGVFERLMNPIKERKTRSGWLHSKNTYDLFILLLIIPISFFNIHFFEKYIFSPLIEISSILKAAIYVYLIIFFLNLFRFFFQYLRWLFPYVELESKLKKGPRKHRIIITALGSFFLWPLFIEILKKVFNW